MYISSRKPLSISAAKQDSFTRCHSAQQVLLETPERNSVSVYIQFLTQKLNQISMVQFCFTLRDVSAHKNNFGWYQTVIM